MMVRHRLRTVVAVLISLALAGMALPPAVADAGTGYTITVTSPPYFAASVTVAVHGPMSSTTTTTVISRAATVLASDVSPGAYSVDVTGDRVEPVHVDFEVVDGVITDVPVALAGRISVAGTVVDADGGVVAGAAVAFSDAASQRYVARTDESGAFVLRNVPTGRLTADFADSYLPDPVQVDVVAGKRTSVRPLVARPGATVTARIVDEARAPTWASVRATLSPGVPARRATVNGDGLLTMSGLPQGRVDLALEAGGYVPVKRSVVVSGAAMDAGTIVLRRGYAVEGGIALPGTAQAGDLVSTWSAQLFAAPAGKVTGSALVKIPMAFDVGGSYAVFAFAAVPAGRYVVKVVERYRGVDRLAVEEPLVVASDDVRLNWPTVSMGPPMSGIAYGGDLSRLMGGEVTAGDVACSGPVTLPTTASWSGVARDGSFSIPTMRGHCYAVMTSAYGGSGGWELVRGLERVRGGTTGVKAHPRLWTQVSISDAERAYGGRSIVVRVEPYAAKTVVEGGTVTLRLGKKVLGKAKVVHGKATVKLEAPLAPGKHRLRSTYAGTTTFADGSGESVVPIRPSHPVVKISASRAAIAVRVKALYKPTGTFFVYIDAKKHKVALHRAGSSYSATFRVKGLAPGRHVVLAFYPGDKSVAYTSVEKAIRVTR